MADKYKLWSVGQLKKELGRRGAVISGRKLDLYNGRLRMPSCTNAMCSCTMIKVCIPGSHSNLVPGGRQGGKLLEAYDRNHDFKEPIIVLPPEDNKEWPDSGFHQLLVEHKAYLPKLTREQVEGYFIYRIGDDKENINDIKALRKGKDLIESRILACSILVGIYSCLEL